MASLSQMKMTRGQGGPEDLSNNHLNSLNISMQEAVGVPTGFNGRRPSENNTNIESNNTMTDVDGCYMTLLPAGTESNISGLTIDRDGGGSAETLAMMSNIVAACSGSGMQTSPIHPQRNDAPPLPTSPLIRSPLKMHSIAEAGFEPNGGVSAPSVEAALPHQRFHQQQRLTSLQALTFNNMMMSQGHSRQLVAGAAALRPIVSALDGPSSLLKCSGLDSVSVQLDGRATPRFNSFDASHFKPLGPSSGGVSSRPQSQQSVSTRWSFG